MNLAQLLSEVAQGRPDKPAIVFEGEPCGYGRFDREVERYAAMLDALGIRKGDRVAAQLPKGMQFLFVHFAALSVGAITLPLNTDYRPDEVRYFLEDSESSLFVIDPERLERARSAIAGLRGLRCVVAGQAQDALLLGEALDRGSRSYRRPYPTEPDDVAMICYTSGTTGRSKGAMITHRNLVSNMRALHRFWEWSERDVLLHVLPLFHVHGLNVATHGGLYAGATIVMHERFDPVRAWGALERDRCTVLMAVPTIYQRLMKEWDGLGTKPDLSGMRVFISGSAPLSDPLFHRFEKATGFRILERYGMTETGMNTSNPIDLSGRKAKSVGYPLPGVEIRIGGPEGGDAAPGQVGEVWIRGENVFRGYWRMPEKTAESFRDGWFRSGDLGYRDPEDGGRLYLVGRAKELIITGGYNVYPKEVENALEAHEAVREAAVFGIPDEDFGERVAAAVVPREGVAPPDPRELIETCRCQLAPYKCPKEVRLVPELPRNAMGKIQKNVLAERSKSEACAAGRPFRH
jgi:malonyl-CoA/methylmalonyl-CoA synthetase